MLRYLFGPVASAYRDQNLHTDHQAGRCLTFGPGDADLPVGPDDTSWDRFAARFPSAWRPDAVVLYLAYRTVPAFLWSAPVPLVGLVLDSNLLWHRYRHLPPCDLLLTDALSAELFHRQGTDGVRQANLFGCERAFLEDVPDGPRGIDVLFVGNLQPAVQRQRLPWLGRLARLARRWRVRIASGVFGDDYRALLRQSRVVFNRSIRQECNLRTFEAAASGALLFQEEGNREVPTYFRDGQECVCYTEDNLETLLDHYLSHEDERQRLVGSARQRVQSCSFAALWQQKLDEVQADWPALQERCRQRLERQGSVAPVPRLLGRTWEALGSIAPVEPALVGDLTAAVLGPAASGALHNALGLLVPRVYHGAGPLTRARAELALPHFERACAAASGQVVAALNRVEALVGLGRPQPAVVAARQLLRQLEHESEVTLEALDAPHFPDEFDWFRVEWEGAAWQHAGHPAAEKRAKMTLLRWRLHALLGDLTGELSHYYEAAVLRPDLPVTRAALGCALARQGQLPEAAGHLRFAVEQQPFDHAAARALYQVLLDLGDRVGADHLAEERRLLQQAAPGLVPPADWFSKTAVSIRPVLPPPATLAARQEPRPPGPVLEPRPPGPVLEPRPPGPVLVAPGVSVAFARPDLWQAAPRGGRLVWEGPLQARHSLGLVNRELSLHLLQRGHDLCLLPLDPPELAHDTVYLPPALRECCQRPLRGPADVHVRLHWPPNFTPPAEGAWVLLQPWEFGSLPRAWIEPINTLVDEVWAPTRFVRDCFVQSGVDAARVQVVPLGVNPSRFHPGVSPLPLRSRRGFKFLFVGGTIHRKGIDVLLRAYSRAFSRQDDVCLVIKAMGVGTFYRDQTAERQIAEIQARPDSPDVEYLEQGLGEEEMARLYRACDCLVQPYRGEGFGLPLVEAMACGLPVIVTGHGAALDFCDGSDAYLIPGTVVRFDQKKVGELETVDYPWLAEPDEEELVALLRRVVASPAEARQRGQAASARIRRDWTWDRAAQVIEQRLEVLRRRRPRRLRGQGQTTASRPRRPGTRLKVSLCLIVKNEEGNLPACLASAADLFDEVVVVDTGSTDRTREIATHHGARVIDFPWCDNFSAARNEGLRHARGDWICWMDADDRLDADNRQKLRQLLADLPDANVGYVMKCSCLPDPNGSSPTVVDHIRLFRNLPAIRWEHRVHEQILPAIRRSGGEVRWAEVTIQHTGYTDPALRRRKLERDLRLLQIEQAEQPEHPFTLFNLGSVYRELDQPVQALTLLRRSLDRSHPTDSIVRKLYALMAGCHRQLGQPIRGLETCVEGRGHYPDDTELLFTEGNLRLDVDDLAGAERCYRQLLDSTQARSASDGTRTQAHFASVLTGLRGYNARNNLAVALYRQRRHAEAEEQWRLALAEQPRFVTAWVGLAELYLVQQRWSEFEEALRQQELCRPDVVGNWVMRARGHLARLEFGPALALLVEAIREAPQALWPRVVLSHALLQEGTDLDGAEAALRDVLALDPNNAEARCNLDMLLRRRAAGAGQGAAGDPGG